MLAPRNIRVHDDTDETPKDVWSLWLDQTRYAKANTDTMKRALQKDGLWLDEETEITGNTIEEEIERLTTYEANEAHWRTQFWELYFFRAPISGQACLIRKTEEQRQCHSHSYKIDQDPTSGPKLECDENIVQEIDQISRFVDEHSPPIVHGVHHSLPSNTLQRCKTSTGYVYNDLVYAVDAWKLKNEDFQKAIKDLPTVSSSQDKTHFGGWLLVEFKRKPSITETHIKGLAVRYGSFTAAVSLHEKLKLCSMASEGSFSKAQYKDLNVHIFSAVGFTAHHYIHCLRPGNPGSPVTYESYPIGIYHLNISSDRNHFRHTLNLLHVYHSTIIRDTELERLQTVVALNPTERYNRLQSRAHKNTWFEIKECKGEETIVPHNESLCHQAIAGEPVSGPPLEGYDTADPDPAEKKQQKEKKQRCGAQQLNRAALAKILRPLAGFQRTKSKWYTVPRSPIRRYSLD